MDWNKHRLWIGLAVLAAMVGLTVWGLHSRTGETPPVEQVSPLPDIDRDAITQIEIRRPGEDEVIRLVKSEGHWRLTSPVQAPAAQAAVDAVLEKLDELEVTGTAARSAQFHERLEVDREHGVRVTVRGGEHNLVDFWLGGYRGGSTMLRIEGHNEVLMVRGSIKYAFNKPPRDWRDRTVTEVTVADVHEITLTNTHGTYHFRKGASAWEQVVPEGGTAIERFDPSKVQAIVASASALRATDFAEPSVTPEQAGLGAGAASVTLVTGEGETQRTVHFTIGNEIDAERHDRYVHVDGNDTVFVVSRYLAERLMPDNAGFQLPEPGATPPPPPPGEDGEGMPPGMPGMPGGGGSIPPEMMEQIRRQLQQQQQMQHP